MPSFDEAIDGDSPRVTSPALVDAEPAERAPWAGTGQPAPTGAATQAFGHFADDVAPMAALSPGPLWGGFEPTFDPSVDNPYQSPRPDPPAPGSDGEYPNPLRAPRPQRPDPGRMFFPEQREEARAKREAEEAARAARQEIKDKEAAARWKQQGKDLRKELDIQPKVEPKGDYPEPSGDTGAA